MTLGPVLIVGAGLVGTSVGLALQRAVVTTYLSDVNREHVRTAQGLGAGVEWQGEPVELAVVAVPPDLLAPTIVSVLDRTDAVVTDVGSVKQAPLDAIGTHQHRSRYVGGHPMAGSERSGPLAASATLFDGRPWAVTPGDGATSAAVAAVEELARTCGALVVRMSPSEHDAAVARTSHLPHLMSVLMAGRLADAPGGHLELSGQGLRDVTRIASSDPKLWQQIVVGNAGALLDLLREVHGALGGLIEAVEEGSRDGVAAVLERGVAGTRAIPGKHGGPARAMGTVFVSVPDAPGSLARLFAEAGASGVNIEDVRIDHDPGRPTGLVELVVEEGLAARLSAALESGGWVCHR